MEEETVKLAAMLLGGGSVQRFVAVIPPGVHAHLMAGCAFEKPSFARDWIPIDAALCAVWAEVMREAGSKHAGADAYGVLKAAAAAGVDPSPVALLRQAKAHSDVGNYDAKTDIVRALIRRDPSGWVVDSRLPPRFLGLTHTPSGFRIHMPEQAVADLLRVPPDVPTAGPGGLPRLPAVDRAQLPPHRAVGGAGVRGG